MKAIKCEEGGIQLTPQEIQLINNYRRMNEREKSFTVAFAAEYAKDAKTQKPALRLVAGAANIREKHMIW